MNQIESHGKDEIKTNYKNINVDFSGFILKDVTISEEFVSDEIERLDMNLNFPPTYKKSLEINQDELLKLMGVDYINKMFIENVDLNLISKINLKDLSGMKYTRKVEVIKNEKDEESHSEFSEDSDYFDMNNTKYKKIDINNIGYIEGIEFEEEYNDKVIKHTNSQSSIDNSINELKHNINPSHFISLTFNKYSDELKNEFNAFKRTVKDSVDFGNEIDISYFISENKLHITLGLVRIENDLDYLNCKNSLLQLRETKEFIDIAELCSKQKGFPLIIQGLSSFGSTNRSRVIYGNIYEKNKVVLLKRLWNKLCTILIKNKVNVTISEINKSICFDENDKNNIISTGNEAIKLLENLKHSFNPHVTFINTKYGSYKGNNKTFNSSKLKKVFSNKRFGIGYISEIELNELTNYISGEEYKNMKLKNESVDSTSLNNKYNSVFSIKLI
ncbi:hypothetical protein FG386_001092 [Cryptosporidium ryanae]|uniref:uncharacterized protein n=1 Tax=Cryptosporidium ryanae TaxID=515981 RepID=UPI003519E29E|nr:hypothetical protein FG386_001092 [Cryptosporidium ryanae]